MTPAPLRDTLPLSEVLVPLSAVDCIQPAIQHTKEQLFTRFRLGQWSRLALVGILAAEMHASGCNFGNFGNFNLPTQKSGDDFLAAAPFPHIDPARIAQFAGVIALALFALMILFFVFLYLNSIFRFILFDSVLRRECSISRGWQRWRRPGGRFFLWQLVFQIVAILFLAVVIGIPVLLAISAGWMKNPEQHAGGMIGGVLLLVGVVLLCALASAIVQILAKDFLVPIMALEDLDFADGWGCLLGMMRGEVGKYAIYILLKIVLSIAAAILFGIIAIIPTIVVAIPSVVIFFAAKAAGLGWNVATVSLAIIFGSIAILVLVYLIALTSVPATVFFPAYAMYFFASRYPNLDALLNPAPPAPVAPTVVEPPVPESPPPLPPAPEPIG